MYFPHSSTLIGFPEYIIWRIKTNYLIRDPCSQVSFAVIFEFSKKLLTIYHSFVVPIHFLTTSTVNKCPYNFFLEIQT